MSLAIINFHAMRELAETMDMDPSHLRRFAIRRGYKWYKVRDRNSRQMLNALPENQALQLLEARLRWLELVESPGRRKSA